MGITFGLFKGNVLPGNGDAKIEADHRHWGSPGVFAPPSVGNGGGRISPWRSAANDAPSTEGPLIMARIGFVGLRADPGPRSGEPPDAGPGARGRPPNFKRSGPGKDSLSLDDVPGRP